MSTPTQPPPYDTRRSFLETICTVEFIKDSGPGGQHRNKRQTGIRLTHPPSGVVVHATERRSQTRNRDLAFDRLIERLADLNYVPKKRIKTKVPRSAKRRRLENKKRRSAIKSKRKPPSDW